MGSVFTLPKLTNAHFNYRVDGAGDECLPSLRFPSVSVEFSKPLAVPVPTAPDVTVTVPVVGMRMWGDPEVLWPRVSFEIAGPEEMLPPYLKNLFSKRLVFHSLLRRVMVTDVRDSGVVVYEPIRDEGLDLVSMRMERALRLLEGKVDGRG